MKPEDFCDKIRDLGEFRCERKTNHRGRGEKMTQRGRIAHTALCPGAPKHSCKFDMPKRPLENYALISDPPGDPPRYHLLRITSR